MEVNKICIISENILFLRSKERKKKKTRTTSEMEENVEEDNTGKVENSVEELKSKNSNPPTSLPFAPCLSFFVYLLLKIQFNKDERERESNRLHGYTGYALGERSRRSPPSKDTRVRAYSEATREK